jgi:WD40 repeat protein
LVISCCAAVRCAAGCSRVKTADSPVEKAQPALLERQIWTPVSEDNERRFTVSPDNTHIAAVVRRGDRQALVLDGKEIAVADEILTYASLLFTAYTPFPGQLTSATANVATFSNDGAHFAFCVRDGQSQAAVVNGAKQPTFAKVDLPVFSSGGKHFAYRASPDAKKWLFVVDGKPTETYDSIVEGPLFSPDGNQVAYRASIGVNYFVVANGTRGRSYSPTGGRNSSLTFSRDGRRLVYEAERDDRRFLVDGSKEIPSQGYINKITFSPDSTRLAYAVQGSALMVDGNVAGKFGEVRNIVFSADSRHLVAAVDATSGSVAQHLYRDGAVKLVDGDWMDSASLAISADGSRVAYAVRRGKDRWVPVGDGLAPQSDAEHVGPFLFSSDSKHIAFISKNAGKARVVADGTPGPESDDVALMTFSPDGSLVYASREGATWRLLASSREVLRCDSLPVGANVIFEDSRSFHLVYERNGVFFSSKVRF